jgi:stage III sporulation protein SpoIIIAA
VIDEIGTEAECAAARTIAQRGVQLVATAHGNELQNLVKNPALSDLIGGIQSVTLGELFVWLSLCLFVRSHCAHCRWLATWL